MKIAVTSTGTDLSAAVDPRFGRCAYFVVLDTETGTLEAIPNLSGEMSGGAGIQAAKLMAENRVDAVLTGNCGPNAHRTMSAAKIDVMVGVSGTVKAAAARYVSGALKPSAGPNVESHAGMGKAG